MEKSVEFLQEIKSDSITAHSSPIFQIFQVEISKLNFKFDNIRTYFFQVLRDCRQINFVMLNGFCPLSKKSPTPMLTAKVALA